MSEGCTADALNYITDLSGHYYRVNAENQLVIAGNKEEAGVFCASEVKERLRKGRKAGFYKVIPVEEVRMVNQLINEVREKEQPDEKRTEIVKQEKESEAMEEKNQEEKMVCESRKKTVYDSRETDWLDFAGKQAEFFEQAEQYAYNLGCDLDEIEEAIEDVLVCIEDANCNAAQGYEVFKKLKDLRNLKKKKERELYAVRVLMEPFNCADMLGAYRYCINALTQND